jgi:geranylgeranyl diphosphate synthase type I
MRQFMKLHSITSKRERTSMTTLIAVPSVISRYTPVIQEALEESIKTLSMCSSDPLATYADLEIFYRQMSYHLGWVDAQFRPRRENTGKRLRPTLLLLAYEAAGASGLASTRTNTAHLRRALPAAAAIELFHNFTLMHDDIEDGDVERRHRPTAWSLWGIPFAINTGDGLYSLSRLVLFKLLEAGVEALLVTQLGRSFDRSCLSVIEGQHLDLSFEDRQEMTVSMYLEMITRKTAALMACSAEMGAMLGSSDHEVIEGLRQFGLALGIAFQLRDDLLGIWASRAQAGKTPAGDLYRRKKTLPVLYALQQAKAKDQTRFCTIYRQKEELHEEQVAQILEILDSTESRAYCQRYLAEQCRQAHEILAHLPLAQTPLAREALADLKALLYYVEEDAHVS